jgi:hypothetical protein
VISVLACTSIPFVCPNATGRKLVLCPCAAPLVPARKAYATAERLVAANEPFGSPGFGLLRFSLLVTCARSTGTIGVPRPVPSSDASNPSAVSACVIRFSISGSRLCAPDRVSVVATNGTPPATLPLPRRIVPIGPTLLPWH